MAALPFPHLVTVLPGSCFVFFCCSRVLSPAGVYAWRCERSDAAGWGWTANHLSACSMPDGAGNNAVAPQVSAGAVVRGRGAADAAGRAARRQGHRGEVGAAAQRGGVPASPGGLARRHRPLPRGGAARREDNPNSGRCSGEMDYDDCWLWTARSTCFDGALAVVIRPGFSQPAASKMYTRDVHDKGQPFSPIQHRVWLQ